MWVPQAVPSGRGGREASTSQEVKNLIGLLPTPSSLTLLDTDPDIDPSYGSSDHFNLEEGGIRLDSDEEILVDKGEEFWRKFLPSDNEDLIVGNTSIPQTNGNDFSAPTSPLFDLGAVTYGTVPIESSSADKYKDLFKWDFTRYSFPSRQIKIAKAHHKPKKTVSKEEEDETKEELERIKREIRGALGIKPPEVQKGSIRPPTKVARRFKGEEEEDRIDRIVQDLLGDYIPTPSTSILDMDNEDLRPSGSGRGRGYKWTGPVRDIETGRPVTPYMDDPDSNSNSRPSEGRKQTAKRGKPFPSASSRGSSTSRGRGGLSRGESPRLEPIHGIRPNLEGQASWIRTDKVIPNKASTQSLPSKSAAASSTHHHPSMPPGTKIPGARPINNPTSPYFTLISKRQARGTVPRELLHSNDELQRSTMRSWANTRASPETQKAIIDLLEWLSATINLALCPYRDQKRKTRRFEVDVFGSVAWGGETGSSGDLDLVVLDRDMAQGYHPDFWRVKPGEVPPAIKRSARSYQAPDNLPKVYDMWKFSAVLRQIGMQEVVCIRHASTPIIKFKTTNTGVKLDCDVCVNDLGGWYNSALILAYCEISPFVLRPLVHALKLWASAQDLNDPSGSRGPATMSSYCLTLLAIGYLQQRGHLPNLQSKINIPIPSYPTDTEDPDLIWVAWGKGQGIPTHVAFSKTPPKDWVQRDKDLTASEAIRGFFSYFSSTPGPGPRFDREGTIVSVPNGGVVPRAEGYMSPLMGTRESRMEKEPFMGTGMEGIQPSNWRERLLIVQDPFIWQKSCTSAMHLKGLDRWFAAVDRTHTLLETKGEAATINDLLIPPPAPEVKLPGPPKGPGQGDRVQRYAKRMYGSRGRGRGGSSSETRTGNGNGNGGGPSIPNAPVEKLLDL